MFEKMSNGGAANSLFTSFSAFSSNWGLVFILLLNFVLHCTYANWPYLNPDEGVASCVAVEILHGGAPYIDAVDHRGPVTYYIYSLGFLFSQDFNMVSVRVVFAILSTLILWVYYLLICDKDKTLATISTAVFFMFMFYGNVTEYWAFHTEWPLVFFNLLAILLLKSSWKFNTGVFSFGAGVSFCLACLSKQIAVFDLIAFLVCTGLLYLWGFIRIPSPLFRIFMIALGGITTFVLVVYSYFSIGGLDEFMFYVFDYNIQYYGVVKTPYDNLPDLLDKVLNLRLFGPVYLLIFGLLITISIQRGISFWKGNYSLMVIWTIYFLIVFVGVRMSGRNFGHYYIPLIPLFSLACGALALQVHTYSLEKYKNVMILAFFVSIGVAAYIYKFQKNNNLSEHRDPRCFQLDSNTSHIFVWGFEPEIYIDLATRPATRYSFCNFQTGKIPGRKDIMPVVPGSRDTLMLDLEKTRPQYIFNTSPTERFGYEKFPLSCFPQLNEFIQQNYRLMDSFEVSKDWRRYEIYTLKK